MPADRSGLSGAHAPALSQRTLQMSVANMTFMVDRLGKDCSTGQFVRELTENGIAALEALPTCKGEIIWDVEWSTHTLTGRYKLAAIDTGVGMTGPEMVTYINKLSSSVHKQSTTGNYGVGAKISAAPLNPEGIIYMSWKDGKGSMVHLWRDPVADVYGLKMFERPDGTFDYWGYVDKAFKPEAIKKHGTMVILLGNSEEQNTMEAPSGLPMPAKWILRYLNSRYFRFPKGVTVKIREGYALPRGDKHNFLRVADGMEDWLARSSEFEGSVQLTGAIAHWWILSPEADVNSGHFTPAGHTAALFQDELYDPTAGRAGVTRLQSFGIVFGHSRVVIYVAPDATTQKVEANTARNNLSINGQPMPWSDWANEFREHLPEELQRLVDEVGAKSASSDHKTSIRERLRQILDLFRIKRYRATAEGANALDPSSLGIGGSPRAEGGDRSGRSSSGGRGGRAGSIYALFLAQSGEPAEEVLVKGEPDRKWVTFAEGTRSRGDMEDRAAKFIQQQNLLLINGDFRVFTDMVERWQARYDHSPGSHAAVQNAVREWFEQQLVEAVVAAQSLSDSPEWTGPDLELLWSEESLTAVVLPRWHVNLAIGRALGGKLGTLKERSA
jgi:hypothetical protein